MSSITRYIPNTITSLNILSGCISIVLAFEGYLIYAAYLIGVAAIFDFLDGMTARLFNAYSEIGKQLDSLADLISFGLAPSVIMFQLISSTLMKKTLFLNFMDLSIGENLVLFSAFIIAVSSAFRLAKFNIDTRQTDSFIGLPTPANAILIASLPLIIAYNIWATDIILNIYFLVTLTFFQSYMLVAEFPMFSLKFKSLKFQENKMRYVFLGISVVLIAILHFIAIPVIILIYILLSGVNNLRGR